jgi:hypothetical protein
MNIIKLHPIQELSQDFENAPVITRSMEDIHLIYKFETIETGGYQEKMILFVDVKDFRFKNDLQINEANTNPEIIHFAYNSIARIIDSDWLHEDQIIKNYFHFLVYFDEYGLYEFIAKDFKIMG